VASEIADSMPMTERANPQYLRALAFAVDRHGRVEQARKGTAFPYVVHVIRVAEILERLPVGEDVVVAGFLHDTVEDAGVTYDELRVEFGGRVATLVEKVSEPDKTLDWRTRKQHTIHRIEREDDPEALMLKAADMLDNVRSIRETLRAEGEERTWARFRRGRADQHWYYRSLAEAFIAREPTNLLFRTLDAETREVFPDTASSG
jgi:(p)ppGpp synthase/HD superfamily hydrolase